MINRVTKVNKTAPVVLILGLVALIFAACNSGLSSNTPATSTPAVVKTTTKPASMGTPNIRISPTRGKAGTVVTVVGGGFPPGSEVDVRLAPLNSGATDTVYGKDQAGQHGNIQVTFTMPQKWPNGEQITLPRILVVATTPDFVEKATGPFLYEDFGTPPVTPTRNSGDLFNEGERAPLPLQFLTDPAREGDMSTRPAD